MRRALVVALLAPALGAHPARAATTVAYTEGRAPCADRDPLRRPFFGDLHVHTSLSLDAATQDTRATPRDAYRFARGEPLGIPPFDRAGRPARSVRLRRPLDFMAVTDHAELFGEVRICGDPTLDGYASAMCRLYRWLPRFAFFLMMGDYAASAEPTRYAYCGAGGTGCRAAARGVWDEVRDAAEEAYDRTAACRFTSFVGYEWTLTPDSVNLHRNVLFRTAAVPADPVTALDAPTPEALWATLRRDCLDRGTGCDVVVVPHNSNLSAGTMFETVDDAAWARTRAALEPIVEITQHKGESECGVGGTDEECAFEKLPYDRFGGKFEAALREPPPARGYVRHALGQGLLSEHRLGANPFKLGFIGSTDTHVAAAGLVDEDTHVGHGGAGAPVSGLPGARLPDDVELNPGGLAVVWAEENSRDALFAAMRRREAYATSGPRIVARFFGGFDLPVDLCARPTMVADADAVAAPMGGELPARPGHLPPAFLVWAARDPGTADRPGTGLAHLQIVKGWIEGDAARERVIDVAGDTRSAADVDLATCTPRGRGADTLCTVWTDPDFDPARPAYYYARILENPSCRWTTWACNAARVDCSEPARVPDGWAGCCDPSYPKTIRERAWTSPIWWTPAGE